MERCTLENNGFIGVWYPGNYRTDVAIIAAGGASCDEKTSVSMCRYLRNAGYNVLVLGFYLWEGLQKDLVSIPVEYAERAAKWLKNEKNIKSVAMTAASTGAGYTLLSASLVPEISCIIPVVPYDYIMEGTTSNFKRLGRSLYTWRGKDVPYSPWTLIDSGLPRIFKNAMKDKQYGLKRFMRYGYDHNSVIEESRIRVENMYADVLYLAVKDDDAWPSDVAVPRMVNVLKENNYPYRVEYHIYEKASHALTDGLDEMIGYAKWALKHMLPAEKNTCISRRMARTGRKAVKLNIKGGTVMNAQEFGTQNSTKIVLIPGNMMCWKQFEHVIPLLEKDYHVTAISTDGYDGTGQTTFTTAEASAEKLETYIRKHLGGQVDMVFGESFGCAIAGMLFHRKKVTVGSLIMNGPQYMNIGILDGLMSAIIPRNQYRFLYSIQERKKLPWLLKLYTRTDDEKLLNQFKNVPPNISRATLQNCVHESFALYEQIDRFEPEPEARVSIWYGAKEPNMKKAVKKLKRAFPNAQDHPFKGLGHGEIIAHPDLMVREIEAFMRKVIT